jgi:hypothetical protein
VVSVAVEDLGLGELVETAVEGGLGVEGEFDGELAEGFGDGGGHGEDFMPWVLLRCLTCAR